MNFKLSFFTQKKTQVKRKGLVILFSLLVILVVLIFFFTVGDSFLAFFFLNLGRISGRSVDHCTELIACAHKYLPSHKDLELHKRTLAPALEI